MRSLVLFSVVATCLFMACKVIDTTKSTTLAIISDRDIPSPRVVPRNDPPEDREDSDHIDDPPGFEENGEVEEGDLDEAGIVHFAEENDANPEDVVDGGGADSGESDGGLEPESCIASGEVGCRDTNDCCSGNLQCIGNGIEGKGVCAIPNARLNCVTNRNHCSFLLGCCSGRCLGGVCVTVDISPSPEP